MWPRNHKISRLFFPMSIICLFGAASLLNAQERVPQKRSVTEETNVRAEETSTRIGDSGYKVTIPEIKLQSIIGGKPKAKTVPEEPESNESKLDQAPIKERSSSLESEKRVDRLPFDPVDVDQTHPIPSRTTTQGVPEAEETPEKETSLPKQIPETAVSEPAPGAPPEDEVSPVYHPPIAPEEILDTTFVPKKEILPSSETAKQPPITMLDSKASKSSRLEIATTPAREPLSPDEWLSLDLRGPSLVVQLRETEKEEIQESPQQTAQAPYEPEAPSGSSETQRPETPSASLSRELTGEPHPVEQPASDASQGEQPPSTESAQIQAKEIIPSPLDEDALDSREARDYLRQTAPILEELSLLMTRAPGLPIEDYDPSDTSAALVPADIRLKLTSLKRELQVLDSKTFAIIPPSRYQAFHSIVRESIAHAYQACDAIINYFEENNPENFLKAKEHLVKAGELIRKTIKTNGSS